MSTSKKHHEYRGDEVVVSWEQDLCIHVQECVRARNELFDVGRRPWVTPDVTDAGEVVDVVGRCPTGALSAASPEGAVRDPDEPENTVTVANDGPLFLRGDLLIEGVEPRPGISRRAALCRCGTSANKPFCDNSHRDAGFRDSGAVGETAPPIEETGGQLTVSPKDNGPLVCHGNMTVVSGHGRRAWQGTKAAFCRCGHSANKPFCDGSHVAAGFRTDDDEDEPTPE